MLAFTRPMPDIIHVTADNQFELTSTFVRPQEFYESPYEFIRGRYGWNVYDLASTYISDGKEFDYFTKWNGMNMPGHVVEDFFAHFSDLTKEEVKLNALVWRAIQEGVNPRHFYLIGTHDDGDITHEIAHALFYLDKDYTNRMLELIDEVSPNARELLKRWLLDEREYSETVLDDELQAYFATSPQAYLYDKLANHYDADVIFKAGEPFRAAFKNYSGMEPLK